MNTGNKCRATTCTATCYCTHTHTDTCKLSNAFLPRQVNLSAQECQPSGKLNELPGGRDMLPRRVNPLTGSTAKSLLTCLKAGCGVLVKGPAFGELRAQHRKSVDEHAHRHTHTHSHHKVIVMQQIFQVCPFQDQLALTQSCQRPPPLQRRRTLNETAPKQFLNGRIGFVSI